jgi:hypothetical protein
MANTHLHAWKFQFRGYSKGEHWYTCSICGESDWLAGDKTVSQMLPKECKPNNNKGKFLKIMLEPNFASYEQLSEEEVALINECKNLAAQVGIYIRKLQAHPGIEQDDTSPERFDIMSALDQRWINAGASDLQRGFEAIIRGIAKPAVF